MAYPNPTSEELTIEAVEEGRNNEKITTTENEILTDTTTLSENTSKPSTVSKSVPPGFEVRLRDKFNQVLRSGKASNGKIVLDVRGIAEGIYYLSVNKGGELTTKQISIRH